MKRKQVLLGVTGLFLLLGTREMKADSTWVYAVQISAVLQTNPPAITLSWIQDMYGAKSYTVYRKSQEATNWGPAVLTLARLGCTAPDLKGNLADRLAVDASDARGGADA